MKAKGGPRNQPAPAAAQQPPLSPTGRGAKYRNRDGSKFITLPDTTSAPSSAQPSPTAPAAPTTKPPTDSTAPATSNGSPQVNRKKQKRREKERAKAAAAAAVNGVANPSSSAGHGPLQDPDPADDSDEGEHLDSQLYQPHSQANGHKAEPAAKSKKSKKKKKKGGAAADEDDHPAISSTSQSTATPGPGISRERIWNTSSQEERERIKEFWLGLGENERKSLVKVEKDAVLKKMKEQQKHTCSCSVCGRKRTAIEEELEGLYDAYYDELEQFANHPQQDGHPPMLGSSQHLGLSNRHRYLADHQPSRGRIMEHVGDEDDEEEEADEPYSDDELDEDAYSDDDPEEEVPRDYASDFFNFGSSLTVQGGILTVADDLLKNDGKKFIEMMEQLAERRMAREVDTAPESYTRGYGHGVNGNLPVHDHPPPPPVDDDEYDDDEEDDYDSQEDDEYEEDDDDDTMTEEQRMEEGRRMFQIFAARMFEQRVLQAYREKVARERQAKLMEEEEEERRKEEARKEKKAKEAQKKKEKAAQKKAAAAEEKARKEAEKAAEEEARRKAEADKAEEARRKAEEKRKKREAQKKEEDEERARKEAERQRQRQLQAEQERKAKEAKEREKKAREERQQREKEARDQKEREARELKEKQDAEKRQKDKEAESKPSKVESKTSQKQKQQEERAAKKAAALATPVTMTLPKRPAQHATNPALPVLPQQTPAATFASPKPSVATPALPKAPTPIRPPQTSQQDGTSSGPGTASVSENTSLNQSPTGHIPAPNSPGLSGPPSHRGSVASHQSANASHAISPLQTNMARFPSNNQPPQVNMPPLGMPFPPGFHGAPPGFANPIFPPAPGFRPPPGMGPPGLTSPLLNRGFPTPGPPPGFHQHVPDAMGPFGAQGSKDAAPSSHSRQPSGGFESPMLHAAQPIGRPTPIGRPASVVHGQRPPTGSPSAAIPKGRDDMENHLGSSALLDDSDDVMPTPPDFAPGGRRGYVAPGRPQAFPAVPFGDPGVLQQSQLWGASPIQAPGMNPFAQAPAPPPGLAGPGGWPIGSPVPGFSAPMVIGRPSAPSRQPATVVRQRLCQVCRELATQVPTQDGFIPLHLVQKALKDRVEHNDFDILALCETEGTLVNGGGNFDIHGGKDDKSIRWNPDSSSQPLGGFGAPGQLTSPSSSFSR